jgi:transcriptional regulator with XRE-family HTH domain
MSNEEFGARLFKLRKEANMSQYELPKKLEIHPKNIGKYERNEYTPNATIVKNIAQVFGVTTDYLLFGTGSGSQEGIIHIKDRELARCLQEVNELDDETRQIVVSVLKMAIKSHKAKQLLNAS